jgi:sulfonate transport system substrate-binding protein
MPKGIDAVVPWDYTCSMMINERKNGRSIDVSYPYNIYQGSVFLRKELVDNVPDVVQAITDAIVEATLWIRLNPDAAVATMQEDPNLKSVPATLLQQQMLEYNNLYKPTYLYPMADFWARENEKIARWLFDNKRLQKPFSAKEFTGVFAPEFMQNTFERLGWKIPTVPPTIPQGWAGKIGELPYPAYDTVATMKTPQNWPESSDLTRAYAFNGRTVKP